MTVTYADITQITARGGLRPLGGFRTDTPDSLPHDTQAVILLGPDGARFWPIFTQSPEYLDRQPDPVDRWSTRVISDIAQQIGATALFPFGHTPPLPFIGWALKSGQAFVSRANLLIHAEAGLWVSYRGALALPFMLDLPGPGQSPCDSCPDQPCLTACPPRALTEHGYDIPACHSYLNTEPGQRCMTTGCAVRAACPVSQHYGRPPEQSAHHMSYFHR